MSGPTSREGTQFGPYRLLRLLGKGGMGEVYEAEDTVKDRVVALKLLPESVSHDPVFRKRLQREAHSAGRLQEPHVVPIHDYGEIDGVLYVDMRMINGSDLRKILKNFGPMTPARAVAIVRQIASALDAAHEGGIMHRDVKPENVLVNRDDFAYLVDFGIANAASDEKLTELGTAVGTYAYMAPERFTSDSVTYRADIYALACVLHECLTGSQPFVGDSLSTVITAHLMKEIPRPSVQRPGIPAAFDQVIERGMAKKPEDRYASAGDLAMAATAALTARDQDQAETILQRGVAATMPGTALDSAATMAAPTPPPGTPPPPPYGATPTPGVPPPPFGATPTPGTTPPPPYGATPASFAATPPPSQPYGFTPPPSGSAGGNAWPPPPPPPGGANPPGQKPKGNKGPLIAIGAIACVLVLVLAAIGIFFLVKDDNKKAGPTMPTASTSKTPERSTTRTRTTTEPTPTENPDSFQAKLMALIPDGYPTSVCEAASPPSPGALATIDCQKSVQPGGPEAARYSIFADKDQLILHFNESLKENDEVLRCPGADSDSPIDWNFKASPDEVAGQVACGTYQGNADVMWTQFDKLVLADVHSTDMASLHDWWLNYS
ncbi:serine/threonine protein kinase [Mycolicibacterium sp. P9-64]|uniref:serine/threonine-protein kinase n=1 Tax=Mycolicibacterium sp. P9-64 TaxID=2024612 RepID=UPI0011EDC1F7|nr:serine/threonine-protein kinase [Mycolicibacterium sp. P9-64]KAA0080590.1 serine/threonine protein kinase [Mycolicibacterium sp. P9-64]